MPKRDTDVCPLGSFPGDFLLQANNLPNLRKKVILVTQKSAPLNGGTLITTDSSHRNPIRKHQRG